MNYEAALDNLMRAAAQVKQSVSQVRGNGEAAGGWVKVEVTGDGEISNMYLDDQVRAMSAHELGRAIREAQRTAIADAMQRVHDIQAQITENVYVTTVVNRLASPASCGPQPSTQSNAGITRTSTRGMTEEELDASQDAFSFDPLGRRNRR